MVLEYLNMSNSTPGTMAAVCREDIVPETSSQLKKVNRKGNINGFRRYYMTKVAFLGFPDVGCPVCLTEKRVRGLITSCGHLIRFLRRLRAMVGPLRCPVCRTVVV